MIGLQVALGVFFFGGLGSVCRWWVHKSIVREHPRDFPLGTFTVNILGAFLIGVMFGAHASADEMKIAATGFLGGFTTFSTWMYESERLVVDGYNHGAARNIVISSAVGFLVVTAGVAVGQLI
jgi:CrcB protein